MSVSLTTPTFKVGLTPEEKKLYSQLFKSLDPENTGIITGEKARSTFEKSGLPPSILGEIWQIADQNNLGFLTQFGFCYAMRLIGYTQNGQHPTASLGDSPGPLPKFTNLNLGVPAATLQPQSTNSSFMQTQPSSAIPELSGGSQTALQDSFSSVTTADFQKFSQLFIKTVGSPRGELSGDKARGIFVKAKLPTVTLGHVWSLVDRENSGKLGLGGFVIAMHLIQGLLSGSIKQLPPFLPENIWNSVQSNELKLQGSIGSRQASYGSVSSQQTAIRHTSTSTQNKPPEFSTRSSYQNVPNEWKVTPAMKKQFDSIFRSLDKGKTGHLSPNEVASFLMTSQLNQHDLAMVWDLSDIQNTGVFTSLEFSIALFLVNKKLAGESLPNIVPAALIESIEKCESQPSTDVKSAAKPQEKQKSAMDDLVDIFGSSNPSNPVSSAPAVRASAEKRPSSSDLSTVDEVPRASRNLSSGFKPSSTFGQSLLQNQSSTSTLQNEKHNDLLGEDVKQAPETKAVHEKVESSDPVPRKTVNYEALREVPPPPGRSGSQLNSGTRSMSPSMSALPHTASSLASIPQDHYREQPNNKVERQVHNEDLLADSNPEISGQLSQATTDIANVSTQIKSLTNQTAGLHEKKVRAEQELSKILSTKQEIENKLKSLKLSYENEVQQVDQVEANLAIAREESEALRSEASISEAKVNHLLNDLNEKQLAMESLQKENGTLKERLGYLNAEVCELEIQVNQVSADHQQLTNKVSVKRSQVQVSIVKNEELKKKLRELEESNRNLEKDLQKQIHDEENSAHEYKSLSQQVSKATSQSQDKSAGSKDGSLLGNAAGTAAVGTAAVGTAAAAAVAGAAGIAGRSLFSSHDDSSQKSEQNEFSPLNETKTEKEEPPAYSVGALVDEVKHQPSADMTGVDDLAEVDKDAKALNSSSQVNLNSNKTLEEYTDDINGKYPKLELGASNTRDNTNQTNSSNATTENKSVDGLETPITSPSNSDFQFPEGSGAGIAGGMVGMPGVLVGVLRTDSLTSSVQNNAALSVRDDNIDEFSDRETIENESAPNTAGTAVIGYKEPRANNNGEESSDGDKLSSGVESFELVNAEEAKGHESQVNYQSSNDQPSEGQQFFAGTRSPTSSNSQKHSQIDEEFPPIKELDYDESSSDDDSHEANFDDAVDNFPGSYQDSPKKQVTQVKKDDPFDGQFDDLEVAEVDDDTHDDFENKVEDIGFSDDFTNEPFLQNETSQLGHPEQRAFANKEGGGNDEWEQLFAGFGNAQVQSSLTPPVQNIASGHSENNSAVQELLGMGFDEKTALDALNKENGDLEAATNYLLDHA